ncbi:hypothetical protein ACRYCC_35340 [Actinomadura scrupuli]|uniref:hypothetical protein n=1 Tax=Actinomadura scrupuli TaxID=559629 RepID=UPI003D98DB58
MSEEDAGSALKLLDGVVEEEVLTGYLKLLAADGCPGQDAEAFLGSADLVRALTIRGMAYLSPADPTNPPRLIPAPADLALEAVLAELCGGLNDSHERLISGHQRLRALRQGDSRPSGGEHPAVQVVTDRDEITRLSYSLSNTAVRDLMTLDNCLQETPIDETTAVPPLPRFKGSIRCRSIYETACLEHPVAAKVIEVSVQAGEEARVLPRVVMKMKLIDDTTAMLPLTATGMGGIVILRSAVIIEWIREYFELQWERALPIGTKAVDGPPLNELQKQILRLHSQGLRDKAVARRTDTSVATVRRHAAIISNLLGAETPFAAGVAAVRRGWI